MSSDPDRSTTQPIRRLRVVPNPTAAARASRWGPAPVMPEPVRTGGRHRKPDPDDDLDAPVAVFPDAATTKVVPAERRGI